MFSVPPLQPAIAPRYNTRELCRIAAITPRQAQWWDEHNVLKPVREKHQRLYGREQVFAALLLRDLRQRGFTLEVARKVRGLAGKQGFVLPSEAHRWLLTNGQRVVLLAHPDVVLAFLEQRRSPAYVLIPLATLGQRMQQRMDELPDDVHTILKRGPGAAYAAALREAKRA